jgi:hypothetical protein
MWTARKWEMIPDINRDYPITFRITQGFSGEKELCLPVSRFQVTDGDRTAYYWTDKGGRKRKKVMPPYFISNMGVARNNIRQFLDSTRGSYVVSLLEGSNPLVRRAFAMAMSHAAGGKSPLVSEALDTWVAARLIESHWRVSSGYSMSDVGPIASEEGHPYRNFNPITPMMDSQFDDLVIREFLSPQRDRILQRLKKMFYDDRRRSNWLEIHLTILIMMSNTGWILKDMMNMMDWKGLKSGSRGGKLTQGYMYTCRTLLAYYHHPYGGSKPFSLDFESLPANDPILRDMSTDQREYMRWMKGEMARQSE